MQNGLVSVIIPAYNCEKEISRCLDSILNQDYPNIETIVIYDESSDGTLQILKKYKSRITIIFQKKTSPSIARNVGIDRANGQFIAFCDSDDFSVNTRIRLQVENLCESGTQATYSDFTIINENEEEMRTVITPEWNRKLWLFNNYICFSSLMVKSGALTSLKESDGYIFDQHFPAFEDYDFLIRLSKRNSLIRTPAKLT
jgi:glycosyltransferase involved in cell wall biosynthesis